MEELTTGHVLYLQTTLEIDNQLDLCVMVMDDDAGHN